MYLLDKCIEKREDEEEDVSSCWMTERKREDIRN
jgi:hypothetical protein